jgi:hypothetical protein
MAEILPLGTDDLSESRLWEMRSGRIVAILDKGQATYVRKAFDEWRVNVQGSGYSYWTRAERRRVRPYGVTRRIILLYRFTLFQRQFLAFHSTLER